MGRIRGMVRSNYKKLEQIYNRSMANMLFAKKCTYERNDSFKVVADDKDSYFSLKDGQVVRVESVCDGTHKVRYLDKMKEELFVQPRVSSELGIHICKLGVKIETISRDNIASKLYRIIYPSVVVEEEEQEEEEDEVVEDEDLEKNQDMNFHKQFVVVPLLHYSNIM